MHESTRMVVKVAIVFQIEREQMIKTTIQFSENPSPKPLTDISDSPIASKVERFLKDSKFLLAHPCSLSKAISPFKKNKINLNPFPLNRSFVGRRGWGVFVMWGGSLAQRGGKSWKGRGGGRFGLRDPSVIPLERTATSATGEQRQLGNYRCPTVQTSILTHVRERQPTPSLFSYYGRHIIRYNMG